MIALTFLVMIGCLVFPIVFVLPLSPPVQQLIASASIALGAIIALTIYFLPKFVRLYGGNDINHRNKASSNSGNDAVVKKDAFPKGDAPVAPTNVGSGADPNAIVLASSALHKLSADEKVQLCQDQIGKWRGMMVQVCEKTSGQSGSNSASRTSNVPSSTAVGPRDRDDVQITCVENE